MNESVRKTIQGAKSLIPVPTKKKIKNYTSSLEYRDVLKRLQKPHSKGRFILMATPEHGNLGDHAIAEAEYHFLSDYFPEMQVCEVTGNCFRLIKKEIIKRIHHEDILIISGGGFLGSLWMNEEELVREIIKSFHENKIVIFPQTIFFERSENGQEQFRRSRDIFSGHKSLLMSVRDKASMNIAEQLLGETLAPPILFAPDMATYYPSLEEKKGHACPREGILACLRRDKEKVVSEKIHLVLSEIASNSKCFLRYTDTVIENRITPEKRRINIQGKLEEFRTASLVVTDRLHGMIFAAITSTPCIAMDNSSGKVAGVYEWIRYLDYVKLAAGLNELQELSTGLIGTTNCSYYFEKLEPVFDDLARGIYQFIE